VTEILTEPVSAPNVWRGDELAGAGRWTIRFTEEDFADFERALAHVSRKGFKDVTEIRAEDFPLSHFQERVDDIVDRLEHGLGSFCCAGCRSMTGSARTRPPLFTGEWAGTWGTLFRKTAKATW
jgi:hypothetical protein